MLKDASLFIGISKLYAAGMGDTMRYRHIHFNKIRTWGVLPEACYLPCEKPYVSFTRPKNHNIMNKGEPTECPSILQAIERRDILMATDFVEICSKVRVCP